MPLCLCMIVNNNADTLQRSLRSIKPFINSYLISDAGSTDNTMEIIRTEFAGIPGVLSNDTGADTEKIRKRLLAKSKGSRVLFLDASLLLILSNFVNDEGLREDQSKLANLLALSRLLAKHQRWEQCYALSLVDSYRAGQLPVDSNLEWQLFEQHGLAAFYLGEKDEAHEYFIRVMEHDIPAEDMERTLQNIGFCQDPIPEEPESVWKGWWARSGIAALMSLGFLAPFIMKGCSK